MTVVVACRLTVWPAVEVGYDPPELRLPSRWGGQPSPMWWGVGGIFRPAPVGAEPGCVFSLLPPCRRSGTVRSVAIALALAFVVVIFVALIGAAPRWSRMLDMGGPTAQARRDRRRALAERVRVRGMRYLGRKDRGR
jgi:hypothetical protein